MDTPIPHVCNRFPDQAGKPYEPSNGTEGRMFEAGFCDKCIHMNPDSDKQCDIHMRMMGFYNTDPEYPHGKWLYSADGWPMCVEWKKWDWGNDGDSDDLDNPKAPEPPLAPNQLMMPFGIWELLGIEADVIITPTAIIERELIEMP